MIIRHFSCSVAKGRDVELESASDNRNPHGRSLAVGLLEKREVISCPENGVNQMATEHELRAEMLQRELLIRRRQHIPAVTLADLTESDLNAFRVQSSVHVYDQAYILLVESWRKAVVQKRAETEPPKQTAGPDMPEVTESGWLS